MLGPLNFYNFIDIFFGIQKFNICNFAVDIRYNLVELLWKTLKFRKIQNYDFDLKTRPKYNLLTHFMPLISFDTP